jgi:hypothetical protein
MQIVKPVDIEDALRVDLATLLPKVSVYAQPAPDDLAANSVCVNCLGGFPTSPVSHGYDVLVDVWAKTPGAAMELACTVQGLVASLPVRSFASGNDWKTAEANPPYNNPDPNRPRIPRCTFRATVGIRGKSNL